MFRNPTHYTIPLAAALLAASLAGPSLAGAPAPAGTAFIPIEPCRIVDTRIAGGKFGGGGEQRDYYAIEIVEGDIAGQGGNAGGCGIPTTVHAVHMVLTAVDPNNKGWVRAWPYPETEPNATVLNFVGGENISVSVPVLVCQFFCDFEWTAKNYGAGIHLVVDVVGYYQPPGAEVSEAALKMGRPGSR